MSENFLRICRGDNRVAIVFVHGLFGDYRKTWENFPLFICQDTELAHCDVICWSYPTKLINKRFFMTKLPDIASVASALHSELNNPEIAKSYSELILVGHSMGGLVVRSMITQALEKAEPDYSVVSRVKRVMLYASPSAGVDVPRVARVHKQINQLNFSNEFITKLNDSWNSRVLNMREQDEEVSGKAYIHTTALVGIEDDIVQAESASGMAHDVEDIPGDHLEVVKPKSTAATSFQKLKEVILSATSPQLLLTNEKIAEVNKQIVEEAEEYVFCVGSRSADQNYLDAIAQKLAKDNIKVYRALLSKPTNSVLVDHLLELFSSEPDNQAKPAHKRNLHVGAYVDASKQMEIALCGNESRALVVLPSRKGIGTFDTAIVFSNSGFVNDYFNYTKQLIEAGTKFKNAEEFKSWHQ